MIIIDQQNCDGCAACLETCDIGAIYLVDNKAHIDASQCTSCGKCVDVCPAHAIRVERTEIQPAQTAITPSSRQSILSAVKSTVVTVGSALLPIVISKIGDFITSKLENSSHTSSSEKPNLREMGRGFRKRYRGGRR